MGNIHPKYPTDTNRILVNPNPDSLDIALICERDHYDSPGHGLCNTEDGDNIYINMKAAVRKQIFRDFITGIYGKEKQTVFRWSTWDTDVADIFADSDGNIFKNVNNVFDVICTMGCPISEMSQKDVDACCRLLRPDGLLIILSTWKTSKSSRIALSMNVLGEGEVIPNCSVGEPFIPVARVPIPNTKGSMKWSVEVWARKILN